MIGSASDDGSVTIHDTHTNEETPVATLEDVRNGKPHSVQ
jgi:hypothetical protein